MTRKQILIAILLVMVLDGIVDASYAAKGMSQPPQWSVPLTLCVSFLGFLWYRIDSDERKYKRSLGLNMAMIALTMVAMPYYLLRSRPRGEKMRALFRCLGFAVLMVLCTAAGAVLSGHALEGWAS
jgi:peptidoglycan/LPS O-acetylase OafA/YrhL